MSEINNPQKDQSNPLVFLFKKSWQYSEGNRKSLMLVWAMFVVAESFNLIFTPMIWAKVMNIVQLEGVTSSNVRTLILLMLGVMSISAVFWFIHGPARVMETANGFKIRLAYRKHLLRGVMTLPMGWHAGQHSGVIIDKIEKGIQALYQFTKNSFEIIYAIVRFIGSFAMLAYLFPLSSVIVIIMMVLTLWIVMRFDKVLIGQYRELNRSENQIAATVLDAVSNITTVIILRVEKLVFNAIVSKTERPYGLFKRNSALNEVKWFLTTMCCAGTIVIVLGAYFLGHIGVSGGVLFGEVFLLYRYLGNIAEILSRFTNLYSETVQRRASVANAEELSDDFVDENFTNHVLPANWQNLSIEGLRFSYESAGEPKLHLDIVSLKIRRGEKIAFVGESGSGKTTLLKVMRDLYRPSELKLSVDGQEIPHGFDGIARAISLVPQAPEIFTATIRENITLGAEHEDDKILHYTGMAQFTEVVGKLPNGLDSSINEKGVNLSGGEQQRLALSRGLLASEDKDILLFDEPTSSLDATTERKIYRNIFAGFDGKTIVSSIHRLHLLPLFDRICVFDNGQIIATGSFDELMLGCPEFQVLWQQYTSGPE